MEASVPKPTRRGVPDARGIDRPGRRSRLTRRVLVEAALSLLDERGVEGLTVRAVTERADLGHGTFYHHFPSTEALLAEALEHSLRELSREMEQGFADAPDKLWVFVASLTRMLRMLAAHPALAWMVGRPTVLANAVREACGPFAMRDVRAMVETGVVSADLPVAMGDLWPWMIVGALLDVEAGRRTLAEVEEGLLRLLLFSLGLERSRTDPVLARLGHGKPARAAGPRARSRAK